jgi:phage terminase large subunit
MFSPKEAQDLLNQLDALERSSFHLEEAAFNHQLSFIEDPARLKALFCTRRAAKSYTGGLYLIKEALENPGSNCLFIGLTRQSAHGIIWKDILRELDTKYKLNIKFNETLLTATLPNGSVIWVTGADTDEQEMNKLLGKKYKLVVIDEASMFSIDMRQLVYGVLKPAAADQRGTICLLGTASNITRGLFYQITTAREPGWSLHQWTAHDNPHVAKQWQEELDEIDRSRPLFKLTALFRQWYLNQWVIDEDALVYKFDESRNKRSHLPIFDNPFHYILGIDLGHSPDPSAFVIGAYTEQSPVLYVIHAEKHLHMDVTAVSQRIKELDAKYKFDAKIIDGSMKMAIAEMNTRHGANVIPADKAGKEHWINLLNSDLIQNKIQFLPQAQELMDELGSLVWETDNGKVKIPRKEHPGLANHNADAMLYLWRYTHAYLHKEPVLPKVINWTKQEEWEPSHLKNLEDQVRKAQNPDHFDAAFEPDDGLFDFKDEAL